MVEAKPSIAMPKQKECESIGIALFAPKVWSSASDETPCLKQRKQKANRPAFLFPLTYARWLRAAGVGGVPAAKMQFKVNRRGSFTSTLVFLAVGPALRSSLHLADMVAPRRAR